MWSASIVNCAPPINILFMTYSIKYFIPENDKEDPLKASCYMQNVNDKYFLLVNGIQSTYAPNIWSKLLCEQFQKDPDRFFRKPWSNLEFLTSIRLIFNNKAINLRNKISPEKQFILDYQLAQGSKSGSSILSVKLGTHKVSFSMLGDNFLFIYNKKTKSLLAYCSMVDREGKLDLLQPCHCLYNDLTLLGSPIKGEKSLNKGSICFVLSKDLACWLIENFKVRKSQIIETLLSLSNNYDFNQLLKKIESRRRMDGNQFDKSTSYCLIILKTKDNSSFVHKIKNWFQNNFLKRLIVACATFNYCSD